MSQICDYVLLKDPKNLLFSILIFLSFSLLTFFKGKEKGVEQSEAFEIDDEEEEGEEKEDVFAKERKKQREMSDFLAENGRDSKKKSKVRPGDDFLLSSKAKEIYANTER